MSIPKVREKIKSWLEMERTVHGMMVIIVVLVGLAGFGLGRLYEEMPDPVTIQYSNKSSNDNLLSAEQKTQTSTGKIVASKNGTKYYFQDCHGVGNIKEENKIYFQSEEQAIAAGLAKASGCK